MNRANVAAMSSMRSARAVQGKHTSPLPAAGFRAADRVLQTLREHPRVWIEAPGGFGKTSYAAAWARILQAQDGTPGMWLSLDGTDEDPLSLAYDLTAAVTQAWPGWSWPVPRLSRLPDREWLRVGVRLAESVRRLGPALVVLDDVHRMGSQAETAALLTGFIEELGQEVRLVCTARTQHPVLPVARWLGQGHVTYVGVDTLRLRATEVAALLEPALNRRREISPEEVTRTTGGWPLAVRLIAEHLALHPDAV